MTTSTDNPIGWFEIGTDDPETAAAFYGDVFGWTFMPQGPYRVVTTGPDHPLQGGIQDTGVPLPEGTPGSYAIFYVQVPDVAASCARIEEHGGKVTVPTTTLPTGLVYAHVSDPAGNHLGVFTPPAL